MEQIMEYKVFRDHGKNVCAPAGYKQICVHLVFDVKYDLRRKARLVAGGHLTDPSKEDVYSGVVSLRSIRICMLLAELNDLKIVTADVGNAYLEAFTHEKLFIVAGPEFGSTLEGHVLLIEKALYGLRSSGA
jgi:hypothetical protein